MKWKSIKNEIPGKFGSYLFYKQEWGAMWFVHLAADGYAHLHDRSIVPIGEFVQEMDYWMYIEEPKEANDERVQGDAAMDNNISANIDLAQQLCRVKGGKTMMDEYISREAAISHPFANGQYDREHASKDFIMGYESYKEWLEALPSADVKPVVYCRDCKYYEEHHYEREGEPPYIKGKCGNKFGLNRQYMVHLEEFCSRGERRE